MPAVSLRLARALVVAAAAASALLSGLLAAPEPARASRGLELALQDEGTFIVGNRYVPRTRALDLARGVGVTRLRVNLLWFYAMPLDQAKATRKPRTINYIFDQTDQLIDAAAKRGIRVHLSLTGPAPRWANARKSIPRSWYKPDVRSFGDFATAAAEHFKRRVDRYSIWNEPNWQTWLGPLTSGPSLYRGLYTQGYAAIKKADPNAKVLIGETAPYGRRGMSTAPLAFLRSLTCVNSKYKRTRSCPPLKADGFAHHPYDFTHAPDYQFPGADNVTMGTLIRLKKALDKLSRAGVLRSNGGGALPIYLTEYGHFASGQRALSVRKRTRYLQQAYSIALKSSRVRSQLQYLLVAPATRSSSAFFNLALLNTRGVKYPQYYALQRWFNVNRGKVTRPGAPIRLPTAPPNPSRKQ